MTPPDCRIYIDTDLSDNELLGIIRMVMFAPPDSVDGQVELFKNEDYHQERRRAFPDGFVFFRFYVDVYIDAPDGVRARAIGSVLRELWEQGIAAVAGCRFEDLLPEHGGFRSPNVPWINA
jgi:hypothetical protein